MPPHPHLAGLPDWRDDAAYRFERLDRAGFAWEWLRRDPGYRAAAQKALADPTGRPTEAAAWGLVAFEPPERATPDARPLWRAAVDRAVLAADATGCDVEDCDAFPPKGLERLVSHVAGEHAVHWLVSDGWRRVRVDTYPPMRAASLKLEWRLYGLRDLAPQILALRRLLTVARGGNFPGRLWPADPSARRWILALRAHDALATGAGQRDIAALLGGDVAGPRWRVRDSSLRLRAQRLAACARRWRGTAFADQYLG